MPVDPEYIEQLVLEEITGTISPEDSITLKTLLEQEPEAYAIWQRMHRQLTGGYIQSVRESLHDDLPVEQVFATVRKRKRRKLFIGTTLSLAASLLVLSVVHKIMRPENEAVLPAPIPSFALKSVALQLPDGQLVRLGSGQQQKVNGITFLEEDGKLSWSGAKRSQMARLIVPPGKDYTVRLPDGTEVTLNATSAMEMPLAFGDSREVTVKGEAYFNVAKNEEKPFRVHLPKSTVQVLGTSFNVNTYDSSQVRVALESGAVKMLTNDGDVLLQPGKAVQYQPGVRPKAADFDAHTVFSWKSGYYVFENTPVAVIGDVIERTYGIQVIIDSKATAEKTYSSRLEKGMPLEKFLERLKTLNNIDYRFKNGNTILHLLYRP
ncbi:FecR domain-containing protein [Chitinophaga filiformis]|uniref:FecR family protein n=1 Tax=Chitinophaga filiformis TaxID=104663 RepID=UPI001F1B9626|nr:FecR family protein [Chitinophaga filiformis]MCF6401256.1 FecR domain-containing protein [Chitinophaga filiformis]